MLDTDLRHPDEEALTAYRPVSAWAIIAFLTGLASPVAFLDPLALLVPAVGIAVATWALHRLAQCDSRPTGRRWAMAGLVLCLFFAAAAPVRFVARRHALHERALAFCEQWIAAIKENRPWLAFELTRPAAARPALDTPLDELSKSEGFRAGYQRFLDSSVVKMLLADRDGFTARYLREPLYDPRYDRDFLGELYEIRLSPGNNPARVEIWFGLERTTSDTDGREQWKMVDVGKPPSMEAD